MFLPHPLLRHRGHGEPSDPCVLAAAHSPKKNPLRADLFFLVYEVLNKGWVQYHPQGKKGDPMKLIIAGARTFTDYQRLCQVLAPDRHRIVELST